LIIDIIVILSLFDFYLSFAAVNADADLVLIFAEKPKYEPCLFHNLLDEKFLMSHN
jgi:hypothetical protein